MNKKTESDNCQRESVKTKENDKMEKIQDFARDLRKLHNRTLNVKSILMNALGTVPKSQYFRIWRLEKGLKFAIQ